MAMDAEDGEIVDSADEEIKTRLNFIRPDEVTNDGRNMETDEVDHEHDNDYIVPAHQRQSEKREEAASLTISTRRSRLLDELRSDESDSDGDGDMRGSLDCENGRRRARRRAKFDSEVTKTENIQTYQTDEVMEETAKKSDEITKRKTRIRGGVKQSRKAKRQVVEQSMAKRRCIQQAKKCESKYPLAKDLLSSNPLNVTAEDPPLHVAHQLAKRMKEPNVKLMKHVTCTVGSERAIQLSKETEDCIAQGGMLTSDGTRRRTAGGIFFTLLKSCQYISDTERAAIFAEEKKFAKIKKRQARTETSKRLDCNAISNH
ncbi:phosphorylated adapter RNA export protein-like [Corticium candelabrum]|uniref:phosphorylated adapter RNA export protein-like n=1 Tax=Corticium candelabrum TaxID=121492 RepID=UPI002E26A5C6|nr:phosphorylated adapter RNA export protein-like [Corticium candelabrum]